MPGVLRYYLLDDIQIPSLASKSRGGNKGTDPIGLGIHSKGSSFIDSVKFVRVHRPKSGQ